MKIVSIVGSRPQFIKVVPLLYAVNMVNNANDDYKIKHLIVHTGQHYDYEMDRIFFEELHIPDPDYNLAVGSGSHAFQVGEMMTRIEGVLIKEKPDWVLVYGDTNTTLAASITAAKLHILLAHVEAGLRSNNRMMPEELNRILADRCSNVLFCPTERAIKNLKSEGFTNIVHKGKLLNENVNDTDIPCFSNRTKNEQLVVNVGDVMYDAFKSNINTAQQRSNILNILSVSSKNYYLVTIHRASTTDCIANIRKIMDILRDLGEEKPIIFPMHPRTKKNIDENRLAADLPYTVRIISPVSYFDMLLLESNAEKIITDSGGVQKEAYFLHIPCITLRSETEYDETLHNNWNILVGLDRKAIFDALCLDINLDTHRDYFGDGNAAQRIIRILQFNQQ